MQVVKRYIDQGIVELPLRALLIDRLKPGD